MVTTRTQPHNRIGLDSPQPDRPELPRSERERGRLWSDIVFEAALALRAQLSSCDQAVVAAAATTLIDLERTRMRHDRAIAGSSSQSEAQDDFDRTSRNRWASEEDDSAELEDLEARAEAIVKPTPVATPYVAATRFDEPEIFQQHVAEARECLEAEEARSPEAFRDRVTTEGVLRYVEDELRLGRLKASDVRPGGFWEFVKR